MSKRKKSIPLPKQWPLRVKSALLHVISLAQFATAYEMPLGNAFKAQSLKSLRAVSVF